MEQLPPPEEEMKALLNFVSKNEASDLHLKAGYPPYIRIGGHLRKIQGPPLPDEGYIEQMLTPLVPSGRLHEFDEKGDLDFSARGEMGDRFRINLFRSGFKNRSSKGSALIF